ncbi:MAG: hypothetical protein KBA71_05990 [Opitutaceae bacterium]|nr:hypothetical protein [Opitutaceae bacterium]
MRALVAALGHLFVKIALKYIERAIALLVARQRVKLLPDCLVDGFTDAVVPW